MSAAVVALSDHDPEDCAALAMITSSDPRVVLAALRDRAVMRRVGLDVVVATLHRAREATLDPDTPRGQRLPFALVAVASGRELLDTMLTHRWSWVADAVREGAELIDVAEQAGVSYIETVDGLMQWRARNR